MAKVIVTIKIMPTSPDVNLTEVEHATIKKIIAFTGIDETRTEIQPVAFGLKAIIIKFVHDENKGGVDPLEESIKTIDGVNSTEVIGVDRALG